MTLLHIKNLSIQWQNTPAPSVHNISFSIAKGSTFALVGESGSGKSITAMSILRLLSEHQVTYPTGEIIFQDQDMLKLPLQQLQRIRGNHIGIIFQEPMSALNPLHTIGKQLEESLRTHQRSSPQSLKERVLELLDEVELPHMASRLDSYPHQLSGGERQRIMIAMAIANHPQLLIADEPTTALDVNVQQHIIALLQKLQRKHNMAILLISHDLHLVKRVATHVAVMQHGNIVEYGDVTRIFSSPKHPYTIKLLHSTPQGKAIPLPKESKEILACNHITVRFPIQKNWLGKTTSYKIAVDDISFTLTQGETLGIVGESGSGKTTLTQAVAQLISSNGECIFQQTSLKTCTPDTLRNIRKHLQYIFQDPFSSLNPRLSIEQIILEGLDVHEPHSPESHKQERIAEILHDVGLEPSMLQRYPHEFSGGQRQRIAIARAMILKPSLAILDEPTSALDLSLQSQILDLLKNLQAKYHTSYIFITHDLAVIRAIAHKIIVMHQGKVVEANDTQSLFDSPQSDYTKTLIAASRM
jgi:microcin C transport system ATP-binding protein